jgi:UDP-N-acetylmuramoyl-tripeptide--D-alanyl-D-alanine ligase
VKNTKVWVSQAHDPEIQTVRARGRRGGAKPVGVDTQTRIRRRVFALRGRTTIATILSTRHQKRTELVDHAAGVPGELVVPDTLRALQELGAWARKRWGGTVIGVTGSAGKTTTKDAIAQLLASEMTVGKTVGNFNNHVGVPLSLLRLPDDCRAGVIEMRMNHAG